MNAKPIESSRSRAFRRAAGTIGLLGLVVLLMAMLLSSARVAGLGFAGYAASWAAFLGHIGFTGALSSDEKRAWQREMWAGPRSLVALFAYLFASDLPVRTLGLRPYRGSR